jgi:dTDP-4-dehydrorhamnose reductase
MNVCITGASGLLGRACARAFSDTDPLTCAWSRAKPGDLKLDLTDRNAVLKAMEQRQPELIIHTAAERRPDICENDAGQTHALNVEATRSLAEAANRIGAVLVYISTDYVFDGTQPPYAVDSECQPLNAYGKSKRAGEEAVLAASPRNVILRVPILYGKVETLDESGVTLLLCDLQTPRPKKIDHWAIRYPTSTDDVAQTLRGWADRLLAESESRGIYHMSGGEALTKYEMACAMAEELGLDHSHLSPDPAAPDGAPRPQNCQLDLSRLQQETTLIQTPFREAIARVLPMDCIYTEPNKQQDHV